MTLEVRVTMKECYTFISTCHTELEPGTVVMWIPMLRFVATT
jgi:hypothetical protein